VGSKNILFVHQNFPAQFVNIAKSLIAQGDIVTAIGSGTAPGMEGVDLWRWTNTRSSTAGIFAHATRAEADLIRAQAAAEAASGLKKDGFIPDIIIGHPGWGETLHLKSVFPLAKIILFGEFYYIDRGGDVGFDLEFDRITLADSMRINGKNATQALAYTMADMIVCPTPFQASTFPEIFQSRIVVQHEGLDLDRAKKIEGAKIISRDGKVIDGSYPVITFVNRNFERLRGFHIFMRALPLILKSCENLQVIVIGNENGGGYGQKLPNNESWKNHMLNELLGQLDMDRINFLGTVPHEVMIKAFSISTAHIYYTYPFVLSWSLIEAMACECLIVGSDTAPVRDVIAHGVNGILNDFFDVSALAHSVIDIVNNKKKYENFGRKARIFVQQKFDHRTNGTPNWLKLIRSVLG
jgi:glycosyltransferase involved in cell wall biosynthesis